MVAYAPRSRAAAIGVDRTGLTGISGLERRYTRFYHDANDAYASGDDATRSKTIAARFDALFPEAREPAALHALPNHDLRLLWRAASRSEEHTSELQSLMRHSYAVFCLKKT